ncbi:hypothetical protein PHYBLDRAFT_62516 [Phycomyces blakesleeanus NRRL 1555(-)]|uniref:Uncharacterized protein n=1 Tax=Phycomyces blakesleeanus (strain ATCC 8743b / DSM 1359 / FGSC 10004 / NBRC 33097 / NRRL 1555) TaxID=763407 RepID=A0A167PXP4_PHYB8|nr:hypothetical protein PHYBLDRAFT_62516 [Phycomyces blakesleeanus NRRL 1555(-)]OAD78727.1 hypothetical protein PHYBLDRAFT_62516 [Phycomyces blakesleeanus NRRL 1555(-)]|eukprot:XP_018296767.1 hypothetical protein PHYBLDRAFT_62516 [Phycomyces blakesleeanus NRRL 1555(-)]
MAYFPLASKMARVPLGLKLGLLVRVKVWVLPSRAIEALVESAALTADNEIVSKKIAIIEKNFTINTEEPWGGQIEKVKTWSKTVEIRSPNLVQENTFDFAARKTAQYIGEYYYRFQRFAEEISDDMQTL